MQGGEAQTLHQQHTQEHAHVYNQHFIMVYDGNTRYVSVKNLESLMCSTNIMYLLQNRGDFLGCFPADGLPPFPSQLPKSMIINTDTRGNPGKHWVALVLTDGIGPSEVRVLPVRRCRRAVWQTKWPLNSLFFLFFLFLFSALLLFSQKGLS